MTSMSDLVLEWLLKSRRAAYLSCVAGANWRIDGSESLFENVYMSSVVGADGSLL